MSVIAGLQSREHFREDVGELGAFLLKQEGFKRSQQLVKTYGVRTLKGFENKFKEFIRPKVVLSRQGIDHLRNVYHDFFEQLHNVTNSNVGSGPQTYAYDKWVFFTTNYDNAIEEYWVKHRKYIGLDLGFDHKRIMDADHLVTKHQSSSQVAMQLVKLHGSVNWIKNREGEVEEHPLGITFDSLSSSSGTGDVTGENMIYPLSQKQLYFTPYIQLFRILEADLERRDFWIAIGYSFRDIIIRNMFEKALNNREQTRILMVHPHPQEVTKLFTKEVRNKIIPLRQYFGRKEDYHEVNNRIVRSLLRIYVEGQT